jgi:hypothetical protein
MDKRWSQYKILVVAAAITCVGEAFRKKECRGARRFELPCNATGAISDSRMIAPLRIGERFIAMAVTDRISNDMLPSCQMRRS